jgi:large conductance mechanosensitive channel
MPEILEHILARRSIRKFTAEPVAAEDIEKLLQAAMAAPSASNRRPWEFVLVSDPALQARLRSGLPLGRYNAPLAIVVCGNLQRAWPWPATDFWIEDCSAATENLLLAATGQGLGAVWIGVHPLQPFIQHVVRTLALPKHVRPLGVVWVGHPAEQRPPRTQFDAARVHWQLYAPRAGERVGKQDGELPVVSDKEALAVDKKPSVLAEFKAFVMRGNVLDLAVGIVVGAAFGAVVNSFVNDVLMPPLGWLLGNVDFSNMFAVLKDGKTPGPYTSLELAKSAGAITWRFGLFINTIVSFVIIAAAVFLVVKVVSRLMPKPAPVVAAPTTKTCPFCATEIPLAAKRCPNCTSELGG